MNVRRLLIQAAAAGVEGGLLALLLALRLNPEVRLGLPALAIASLEWAAWGAVGLGLPVLALLALAERRHSGSRMGSVAAAVGTAGMLALAGVVAWTDAEVLRAFLSGRAHRILGQDAVSLMAAALIVAGLARWGRRSRRPLVCWAAILLALLTPLIRLTAAPTPPPPPARSTLPVRGAPPLLVVGVEGLDVTFLLTHADSDRFPAFRHLLASGAWGDLRPFTPYLRTALWTSAATGCTPAVHGVKSSRAWILPGLGAEPFRVAPWTPLGGRWLLPPWAREVSPPSSRVPPLWARLDEGRSGPALGWPEGGGDVEVAENPSFPGLPGDLVSSLRETLRPFGADGEAALHSLAGDALRCERARGTMEAGERSVWLLLRSLSEVRRRFEPSGTGDADHRVVLGLELEALDALLGDLLEAWGRRGPVMVVSPYGMAPPRGWERIRRLFGSGEEWRASPRGCPDGAILLVARGTAAGRRFPPCSVVDVVPTITYLLGLPLPAWMEGRVILEAITPEYLAATPLVVEE